MWPTMCGHIMKRCGCLSVHLSVCLSVTCHISKTEPDRAIVTMDHYIEVGCNKSISVLGTPLSAPPGVRRPLKGVNRTTAYISKTTRHAFEIFSPSGSDTILLFQYQKGCRYSDGNPPNGGVECVAVRYAGHTDCLEFPVLFRRGHAAPRTI